MSRLPRPPRRASTEGSREHYEQPRYYDHVYGKRTADVAYYVTLAKKYGGPVLEYGVGSGRIALAVARSGIDVVGIDHSAAMLRHLRSKLEGERSLAERVRTRQGDMRRVELPQQFPLVIAPFNTVLHLYTHADVARFFERVKAHLAQAGRFVFDFSMPRPADLAADPERWYRAGRVKHPELDATVRYSERFHYAPLTQILSTWMRFEPQVGETHEVLLTHRQFFPQEMDLLLRSSGFTQIRWTADFAGTKPSAASDVLVVSCRGDG